MGWQVTAFSQNGQGYLLWNLNFYPVFVLSHGFGFKYTRMPIMGSKDLDDSLVQKNSS